MGMNETPSANRVHIGIFGRRNAGKSSLINAITGQSLAIVSDIKGTTTDPVSKAMELLPLGPVVMIDTPGLDDAGELGAKRMAKSYQVLNKTDLAVLVVDGIMADDQEELERVERPLLQRILVKKIPCVIAVNKAEELTEVQREEAAGRIERAVFGDAALGRAVSGSADLEDAASGNEAFGGAASGSADLKEAVSGKKPEILFVSAKTGEHIYELKECIGRLAPREDADKRLVGDLLQRGDLAVLVVPIDSAAPKGRLILPQQQVIRDCLEAGAIPVVTRETELPEALHALVKKPKVVITDSQAFERVAKDTPEDVYLTSFSILMSRFKGDLRQQAAGAEMIGRLKDGDTVLISEGCTHHRQCEDIGTVKMPRWIREFTGKELTFQFTSGTEFPEDLSGYALIVHCGGVR